LRGYRHLLKRRKNLDPCNAIALLDGHMTAFSESEGKAEHATGDHGGWQRPIWAMAGAKSGGRGSEGRVRPNPDSICRALRSRKCRGNDVRFTAGRDAN
jgi:hypothetical protein